MRLHWRSPPVVGQFTDITPGTDADATANPQFAGQVVGDGCVFPKPTRTSHGAQTIGDQLDRAYPGDDEHAVSAGANTPRTWVTISRAISARRTRLGGTDCAHPAIGTPDLTNSAQGSPIVDQYADRHAPFVYFHSVIDDQAHCNRHVVPLGSVLVGTNGSADVFSGHLYRRPAAHRDHAEVHVRHPESL